MAYDFAGKPRLLVSLKSIWSNAGGTVPNRLDDLMGEAANAQQMSPELVIGYVMLFDAKCDGPRRGGTGTWSEYMEAALARVAIRRAPLWNQGLIEGFWLVRFDSGATAGGRIADRPATEAAGDRFVRALLDELRVREPAIPVTPVGPPDSSTEANPGRGE